MNTPTVARFAFWLPTILATLGAQARQPDSPVRAQVIRIEATDRSGVLAQSPETVLYIGANFNQWAPGGTPSVGWTSDDDGRTGWVFEIPVELFASGIEFKFTRGSWATVEVALDGNEIENRRVGGVGAPPAAMSLEVMRFADQHEAGAPVEGNPDPSTVLGSLDIWTIDSEVLGAERTVRVWTPPGYGDDADRQLPVLYMNDGQNVFDAATSFSGEWGADETVTALIEAGEIEPLIVVGVDHSGAGRVHDYLPFNAGPIAQGPEDGGADDYLRFLVEEVMPEVEKRYRVRTGPESTGLCGASLGGVSSLYAAMSHPDAFGAVIIESPSLWINNARMIEIAAQHTGGWSRRVFMGLGDAETGRPDDDASLLAMTNEVADVLRAAGLDNQRRLLVEIGAGQRHHESSWRLRLPVALRFLFPAADPRDATPEP